MAVPTCHLNHVSTHTYTQTTLQLALALPYLLIICYVSGDALARLTVSNSRVEMLGWLSIPQRTYRGRLEIRGVYLPLSGGRDMVKGVGLHPPPSPAWADFSIMMGRTPGNDHCHSAYSVVYLLTPLPGILWYFLFFVLSSRRQISKPVADST
jgi:hypothetical protein